MTKNIYRGTTLIGTITSPSESGAPIFGMEVLVTSEFAHLDLDGDNQFESFERAERHLHSLYETHCEIEGIVPEPHDAEPVEIDEEAAYYAREAAREQEEIQAYEDAATAAIEATVPSPEPVKAYPEPVVDDSVDDDLPF